METLYYRRGMATTTYNYYMSLYGQEFNPSNDWGSIKKNYDYAQLFVYIRPEWFDYDKCEDDGSDIAFYYRDYQDNKIKLVISYKYSWTKYGVSCFILKIPNVSYTRNVELAIEYGKDYEPPSGVIRETGQTLNIADVVEFFDDFDSVNTNYWQDLGSYSVTGSKVTFTNSIWDNFIGNPKFYTKTKYDNLAYQFWFKAKFTYNHVVEKVDEIPYKHEIDYNTYTGIYFDIDETNLQSHKIKGRFFGRGGFKYQGIWKDGTTDILYTRAKNLYPGIYPCIEDTRFYPNYVNWDGYTEGGSYYCGGVDSNGIEQLYSFSMIPKRDSELYKMWKPYTHYSNLTIEKGYPMDGGGIVNYLEVKTRESNFGFCGCNEATTEVDWFMVTTNTDFWGVDFEPEVEPTLIIEEPTDEVCSLIPNIRVVAENWLDSTDIKVDITIVTHPYDEECISFLDKQMYIYIESGKDFYDAFWEYKMQEPDDFLSRGDFKIIASAYNSFGFEMETEELFTIKNCYSNYAFTSLVRDFEKFQGTVTFRLENETEERVNIKHFLQNINKNNSLIPINIVNADQKYNNNYLLGIKTTPVEEQNYEFTFEFEQDEIYDALNKKDIYVDSRIIIYNYDDAAWDVSKFLKEYSFDKTADLGAVELSFTLDLDARLSPFYSIGEPYGWFGNKVEVYQKLKKPNGIIYENKKFTGYISQASASKVAIHIVAHDKYIKFNNKLHEDIHISPDKVYVDEYLTTFDGTKFKSSYSGWTEYPPPRILLGNKQLQSGEYSIDYPRGYVYIFRNTLISGNVVERVYDVEDIEDRKTFSLGFDIDYSSSPIVTHLYREKISDYTCIGGISGDIAWIDRFETLDINDYYINYEDNKLILYVALPEDTATIAGHKLQVSAREILRVSAKYYYQKENTNQVEDIIYDLAQRVGFETSELVDTTTEAIKKGNENIIYTLKNHIMSFDYVRVNGHTLLNEEWESSSEDKKIGKIIFDESIGINIIEAPLDAIVSLTHVTGSEEIIPILDTEDFYYADACIKAENMNDGDYIDIDYNRHFFYKTCGKYGKIALYVKADKQCNFYFRVTDTIRGIVNSEQKLLVPNTWTKIILEANGQALDQITNLRAIIGNEENVTLRIDYFHICEDEIEVKYDYYTLQNTDITVSEAWYLKEETEAYMDIIDDLLEQVEPSYLVYVDENGKLRGEYTKISSYVLKGQVIKRVFVDVENYAGYFYLPDFYMRLLKTAETSVSDEEIYTAVLVLGKLADKNNVALYTDMDDICTWKTGKSYGLAKNATLTNFIKYVPPDIPKVLIKKQQQGAPDTYVGLSMGDGDVYSGTFWYLTSKDGNAGNVTKNSKMVKVTLREPILFEKIAICVGAYQNKIIREEIYIELEDTLGNCWFPTGEFPNKQNGNTGTWIVFENDFNKNQPIKYIYIYCSEPHYWVTSTTVKNSKK